MWVWRRMYMGEFSLVCVYAAEIQGGGLHGGGREQDPMGLSSDFHMCILAYESLNTLK